MNTSAYRIERTLKIMGKPYRYIGLKHLEETSCRIRKLPVSIRILLENILRSRDGTRVTDEDIEAALE